MPTSCAAPSRTAGSSRSTPRRPRRCRACSRIYTGADLTPYGTLQSALPFKSQDGTDLKKPPRAALPTDKVRFVGDPIACVVAETIAQAKDASEAIEVDIESLPAVTTPAQAVAKDAPAIFEDVPGNVCLDFHYGDSEKVEAAFAGAKHKVKLNDPEHPDGRQRDRAARRDRQLRQGEGALHAHTPCSQGVMGLKAGITAAMKTTPDKVHVITGNVGGSFGMKAQVYPEYVCILHAAQDARPPGEVDRRALVELRLRQPRPRPRADRRACARRRRPFPRGAAHRLRQSRRLPGRDVAAAADAQHGAQRHQPLPHAADRGEHQVRVHQHDASSAPIAAPAAPRATTTWSG